MSASVTDTHWNVRDPRPLTNVSIAGLMARLLQLRGIGDSQEAHRFLNPILPDRFDLPNLDVAVIRLAAAIHAGERIAVYGDYDADGITATAVLVQGIGELGGVAFPYIPDRFSEGYGLNEQALAALIDEGARLVVTVDTGTNATHEIAYANERRLDVIVVDHHTPKEHLPDAVAIVNPHLSGAPDSLRYLSGCGVAFVTLAALARHLDVPIDLDRYLDLVAIGTVCDVVPLAGANRALVARGLEQIATLRRPGLTALIQAARVSQSVTAHTLGFVIGPRINAAGRLDHGIKAFELLTTDDASRAAALAAELEDLNRKRQVLTAEAVALCREIAQAECEGAPLVMVGHPDVGGGIVGLVAARLAQEHRRPAIVYRKGAELSVGSARSIAGFDIHAALSQGSHLMERFGGHHQAGGFTVRTDRVDELRSLLTTWTAGQRDWSTVTPTIDIDLELPAEVPFVRADLIANIARLEPFGQSNEPPVFLTRAATVRDAQITKDGNHLRLRIDAGSGRRPWPAIAFDLAAHRPHPGDTIDLVYQITRDRRGEPQMRVLDFAPSPGPSPR
ncbi:MAG: single-stranded-DNA-specific exonuclease RecJ [Dehalococcoidia bacterium]